MNKPLVSAVLAVALAGAALPAFAQSKGDWTLGFGVHQVNPKSDNGKLANCTTSIFSLGGATLDNEWNHIQQKLLRGLGIVPIENQARI